MSERTPEEQARINAIRERFQAEKPSPDELIASGEYEGPVTLGECLDKMTATKDEPKRIP